MTAEALIKIDWKPKWSGGAPRPQVFSGGNKVYLTYRIASWEIETIKDYKTFELDSSSDPYLALVEFSGNTFKFGIANDEVFPGLPLYHQGIEWAQIIVNSKWIKEIKQIHQIHPNYNESSWENLNHYLLTFKDEILEVLATGYEIEIFRSSREKLGQEIITRMNK